MVTQFDKTLAALIVGVVGYVCSVYHVGAFTPDMYVGLTGMIATVLVYAIPNK